MKAILKDYRQSPRKVRLVADLVRGKKVDEAIALLAFANKKASKAVEKLILSAKSNAVSQGKKADALVVKSIAVNEGSVFKRYMPRARGSASLITKRNSHVTVELGEK